MRALVAALEVVIATSAAPCGAEEAPQAKAAEERKGSLGDVVRANLERSYLAYPLGITGLDTLIFEADIVPNFSILPRRWHVALFLTPKIVLRMFAEASTPVKTPSYMPRLTTFFWFGEPKSSVTAYFSAAIAHHSNGQSGPFVHADGSRNHDDGSFDTNAIELAVYPVFWKRPFFGWSSLALEWHPPFVEDADLRATYGNTRLHFSTAIYSDVGSFASDLSAGLTAIIGEMQKPTNASTFLARFPVAVRYAIRPPSLEVGLYAAYYQGQDYYNIWYDRFISVLQIGFYGNLSTGLEFDPSRASDD
jgi:hypothetical protein